MEERIDELMKLTQRAQSLKSFRAKAAAPKTIAHVRAAASSGKLCLVLGAGASSDLKLPMWDKLVDDLLGDVISGAGLARNAVDAAFIRERYGNAILVRFIEKFHGYPADVRRRLRDKLYTTFYEDGARVLLEPICELFLRKGGAFTAACVITYNFDNALERQAHRSGISDLLSVYSGETYAGLSASRPIFHPHGFLPHPSDDPDGSQCSEHVVFSERDYNEHYMDPSHWANVVQLDQFMGKVCVFVGVSLSDPNMRRLLDHAHRRLKPALRHVIVMRAQPGRARNYFIEQDAASLGVRVLWVKEFSDIAPTLRSCVA